MRRRRADPTPDGEGQLDRARGVALWWRTVGEGPRTVVVPCCGNADDFSELCVPDRRVVFYDVRNRGRSATVRDPTRLGFEFEVDDLEAVCDHLAIDRCAVVGWSYHAGVAARFALRRPEVAERLVVAAAIPVRSGTTPSAAPPPAPHLTARLDQLRAEGLPDRDPVAWCEEWRRVYIPLQMADPEGFGRLASPCGLENERPDRVARSMVFVFADLRSYDWRPDLRNLTAPVLVVHGAEDREPVEAAEEWVDAVGDGRLLVMDGVGQYPWAEQPEQFFGTVNRFLAGEPV